MDNRVVATFSLVARDAETGHLGVAVASKFLAVGAVVPTAAAGVAAFASQALANTSYGSRALQALGAGGSVADLVADFEASDADYQSRQFGLVTAGGQSYSHTGADCLPWAGSVTGEDFAAQGNILTGPEVLDAMVTAWQRSAAPFPERLLESLAAGDLAGGDSRGRQSAALHVVGQGMGYGGLSDRWIDLRVDDHADPVGELDRLLGLYRLILGKPSGEPLELDQEQIRWLQGKLRTPVTGTWDDETAAELKRLYGIENLEDRLLEGPRVDPQAWEHLRKLFGA